MSLTLKKIIINILIIIISIIGWSGVYMKYIAPTNNDTEVAINFPK